MAPSPGPLKAIAAIVALALAGCGSNTRATHRVPTASDVAASLRASGWKASAVSGMPHTVTGFPQIAYLATTSPSGTQIDLQFFATDAQAIAEARAAEK